MIPHPNNLLSWVQWIGYPGLIFIIFAECGIFLGFFLPGDSILFTAGLLASQHFLKISILIPTLTFSAIAGYFVAYWIGHRMGYWLLKKKDSFWFKKKYLIETKSFYIKHGGKALIIGRMLPIIRTFLPVVAGIAEMRYQRFTFFNIVGGLIWVGGMILAGFYLGRTIPNADRYILPIIAAIIVISLIPAVYKLTKEITLLLARQLETCMR